MPSAPVQKAAYTDTVDETILMTRELYVDVDDVTMHVGMYVRKHVCRYDGKLCVEL